MAAQLPVTFNSVEDVERATRSQLVEYLDSFPGSTPCEDSDPTAKLREWAMESFEEEAWDAECEAWEQEYCW